MSMLTEAEYEEYIRLLRVWVDAEKALEGPGEADGEAVHAAREAHAAVQSFRAAHGLGEAGSRTPATVATYSRQPRQSEA